MSRRTFTKEFKLSLIKRHIEEGVSFYQLEKENGITFGMVRDWMASYEMYGEDGLERHDSNNCRYSADFKRKVVAE